MKTTQVEEVSHQLYRFFVHEQLARRVSTQCSGVAYARIDELQELVRCRFGIEKLVLLQGAVKNDVRYQAFIVGPVEDTELMQGMILAVAELPYRALKSLYLPVKEDILLYSCGILFYYEIPIKGFQGKA
jgi:hypothetical protein